MVSIGKKEQIQIENIAINNKNNSPGVLDGVFAELFTLADIESNNINHIHKDLEIFPDIVNNTNDDLMNNESILIEKDEKILDAAKSLISIFYKDLETDYDEVSPVNVENPSNKENNKDLIGQSILNSADLNEKQEKNLNFFSKEYKTSKVEDSIFLKKKSKDFNQESEDSNLKKKQELNLNLKENNSLFTKTPKDKKNTLDVAHNKNFLELTQKKLNKKEKKISKLKINVNFENKEIKNSKELMFNQLQSSNITKKIEKNPNNIEKVNIIKTSVNKPSINKPELINNSHDKQEVLDLMESAWGEKFVRTIKNNINRGVNKIDISLNPKNLGKLKVELEIIDDKTEIKINTESKQAAHILSESHQKLIEMMDKENLKLNNFSSMLGENPGNKNNENQNKKGDNNKDSSLNEESKIKENENITKTKKSNHKVDKIA